MRKPAQDLRPGDHLPYSQATVLGAKEVFGHMIIMTTISGTPVVYPLNAMVTVAEPTFSRSEVIALLDEVAAQIAHLPGAKSDLRQFRQEKGLLSNAD